MRFSNNGAVAMAMAASVATATPHGPLGLGLPNKGLDLSKPIHASVDLNADLSGKVLVAGLLADIVVAPIAEVAAGAKVEVICDDCHIKGDIDASISLEKVVPALSLSLKDVEVLLDLDVYIGAAATIAVNLVAPAKVSLPLPGLNVEALVHLDLILGVHTELDVSAGVYVSLPEASLETDILSGDILDADFSGVIVKVLPIKVRVGCTELLADLRLRVDLSVAAALDVDEVLPLDKLLPGLHIPTVGAGLELAVFANLLEYVGLFCAAPECPLAKEAYGLNVGAAVELGVAVEDLLSIHLAPTVAIALLTIPTHTICIPDYTAVPTGIPGPSDPVYSGVPSQSVPGFPSRIPTDIPTGIPTDIPIGSGPGNGYPTGLLPFPTSSEAAVITSAPGGEDLVTTTVSNTATYTVTACAVNVANCPAGYQTCATITHTTAYTTVCPATATASITEAAPAPTETHSIETITSVATTMSSCSSASTFTPPASISTVPFPSDIRTPSVSVPVTPATTVGPIPTVSQPAAGGPSYPVGPQTNSYLARNPAPSYPVAGGPEASYPAGVPSSSYPAPSSSAAYPSTPVPTPSGPSYPNGSNGTVPATSATYEPTQGSTTTPSGYPTSPSTTSPVIAGAGKVGSSIAAVVALVGAVMVL